MRLRVELPESMEARSIPAHKRVKVKPSREGGKKGRKGLRAEEDKKRGGKKQRKGSFERAVSVGSRV